LAKLLEKVGGDELKAWLLPRLRDPDYASRWQASQFLTEVQGGSDVGANAVVARPRGDGSYELHGEKWFCSVANADVFLMTARLEGGAEGTAGLGAFVVPRLDEQGAPNGFAIRRLKDKLGTRHMASAEIDFSGARGWPLGPLEDGFKNIVEVVLTTSRVYNAVSCAGIMRGAELEAFAYAHAREAFGRPIVSFPLVQRSLARIKVTRCAALASSFALARLGERLEAGAASADEGHAFRALVGMNKLVTALRATTVVHEAMEVLGGNGAIEEFSILPTLYRDCYVLEAWEGTHNVLCAQLLRDLRRYGLHAGLLRWMRAQVAEPVPPSLKAVTARLAEQLEALEPAFARVLEAERAPASVMIRELGERMMLVAQGLWLLEAARAVEAGSESAIPAIYEHFVRVELLAQDLTEDPGGLARVALLSHARG
jgi:acyl-CoA dehydrogenase